MLVREPMGTAHLLFRDFLRADAHARDAYAVMKQQQADIWKDDRWAYTEAKTDVIIQLMDRAEQWATRVGWSVVVADGPAIV